VKYNLGTVTSINQADVKPEPAKPIYLELPEDNKLIISYLSNEGYKTFPNTSKELRKELESHCQKMGLVWKKVPLL